MPSLEVISRAENLRRSSRPGFGTRLFCRPLDQHVESSISGLPGIQLTGVNNIQAFNVATNPVRSSHMESPGGFIEVFRGLRDGGEIGFEANLFPDGMPWQQIDHQRSQSSHTIFDDLFGDVDEDELYEMWVVPPRSARYCWLARGFPSVGGPVMYEQEGIMRMMFSFKVSGQPLQLYPVGVWTVKGTAADPHTPDVTAVSIQRDVGRAAGIGDPTAGALGIGADDLTFENGASQLGSLGTYYRSRLIVPRKWETWSKAKPTSPVSASDDTPTDLVFIHPADYSGLGEEANGFHTVASLNISGAATSATNYVAMLYREGGPFA